MIMWVLKSLDRLVNEKKRRRAVRRTPRLRRDVRWRAMSPGGLKTVCKANFHKIYLLQSHH